MQTPRLILDTNVLVAGTRSRRGASFKLLSLFRSGRFRLADLNKFGIQAVTPKEMLEELGELS